MSKYYYNELTKEFHGEYSDGLIVVSESEMLLIVANNSKISCPKERQAEMQSELAWATIQREYHLTNDEKRMVISMEDLSAFSIACRDHVQVIDDVLTIVGEKPKRPIAPKI